MRLFLRPHPGAPFSGYIDEILAVEGFLGCERVDVTGRALTGALLDGQDLVILAHMPLERAEEEALAGYVRAGGRLIALRPPEGMASFFGLEAGGATVKRGQYLQWDEEGCPAGARSTDTPLQFHAEADLYRLRDADALAWLGYGCGARRPFPVAARRAVGDGWAAALAFDLAGSTVFHHQGLPAQASTGASPDPSGLGQYKPDALFIGQLDVTRATIPQADLQQRLLGALVDAMLPSPMPRLWYFPDGEPSLAFLNGDSDAMTIADLDACLEIIEPRGGRYTCYIQDEESLPPGDEAARRERGHSFGKHLWTGPLPSVAAMAAAVDQQIGGYRRRYGYTPRTNRGHCLIWPGWTEMADLLAAAGVRMDSNFVGVHCGYGYLNGSGLPVKFMDPYGRLIDLYEQSTQWEDDVALAEYGQRLTYEQSVAFSLECLREAQERYHTVVNFNFHPIHTRADWLRTRPWIAAVADACRDRRIPMVAADDWTRFNDARRGVTMTGYAAAPARRTVRFTLTATEPVSGLTVTLPALWDGAPLRAIAADGAPLPLRRQRIHDAERVFAWLSLAAGESRTLEAGYEVH